jgi:hypothetical protein
MGAREVVPDPLLKGFGFRAGFKLSVGRVAIAKSVTVTAGRMP